MNVLELRNVRKKYGTVLAVDDVSFEAKDGQILSLLGPSGCGKTTTLRLIAGFEQPEPGGDILIRGQSMRGRRPYQRHVGLVFQDYALFPHMTVEGNIAFGLRERRTPSTEIPERIRKALALVRLSGYEKRSPHQLSGGEQQRVALARALVIEPALLLLDEPLSNLDAKLREELRVELKQILNAAGITTVVVTHDQAEAMSLADHIIVMSKGRVAQRGSAEEIYANPKSRFVAEFIGQSNWLLGRLGKEVAPGIREYTTAEGMVIRVAAVGALPSTPEVGIRPERIAVRPAEQGPSGADSNVLPGTIEDTLYLGSTIHHRIRLASGQRIHAVEQNAGQGFARRGETVAVTFAAADCLLVEAGT